MVYWWYDMVGGMVGGIQAGGMVGGIQVVW